MLNLFPESRHRIRFKDCDPLGHLYNTRYLDYMLEAREDHILEHYELDLEKYAKEKSQAWVVVHHEIAFRSEAKRNEFVRIKSSLIHYDSKKLINEYQMWNDALDQLKSLMWTTFLHVDLRTKKTVEHQEDILLMMKKIYHPIDQTDFNSRIKFLLNK